MSNRLIEACKNGVISKVKQYLKEGDDPSYINSRTIIWSAFYGRYDIILLLLKDERVDPSCDNNYVIQWACIHKRLDIVLVILQDSRFKMTDNLYKYEEVMLFVYQIRQEKLDILIHSSI